MDYGRTATPLPVTPTTPQTQEMGKDFFASAITPGVGSDPEEVNPDINNSLNTDRNFGRMNQASLGSAALNIEPYLPPEINANSVGIAGITEATRINSIDELSQLQEVNQPLAQPETQVPSDPVELVQPLENPDLKIETVTPPEKPKDNRFALDFGRRFNTHDIEKIESTIKKTSLTDLYNLIQNTRENNSEGGKS